jgi:HK97 family phage major capsid protein
MDEIEAQGMQHSLKALNNEGRVGGYLVVWGTPNQRDLQGEFFTAQSELGLDWYEQRPVLYHHGMDGTLKSAVIGMIDVLKEDAVGLWSEAQLDLRNRYVQTVLKLVKRGVLGWSSGSLPHLVEVEPNGFIKRWPIVEGSLTPTPAEPRFTDVGTITKTYEQLPGWNPARLALDTELQGMPSWTIKSATAPELTLEELELSTKAEFDFEGEDDATVAGGAAVPDAAEELPAEPPLSNNQSEEHNTMPDMGLFASALAQALGLNLTPEELSAAVAQAEQALAANAEAKTQATEMQMAGKAAELGALLKPYFDAAFKSHVEKKQQAAAFVAAAVKSSVAASIGSGGVSHTGGVRSPEAQSQQFGAPARVQRTKYGNLSAADMSFMAEILSAGKSWKPSAVFMRELAGKSLEVVKQGKIDFAVGEDFDIAQERANRALKSMHAWAAIKADELDYSTQASFGDEWVPDLWSNQLWELVRLDNVIAPLFQVVEMPSDPFELPLEGADPTVYFVPESKNETDLTLAASTNPTPDSKIGTGKVQLVSKKLSTRIGFSAELVEDSIIPVLSQYSKQAQRAILNAIDNVILNGDTATSGNVNFDGGTPGATDKHMALIGLRRILVDTTANAIDMGNVAPTLQKIREARFAIKAAAAGRVDELAIITHGEVYAKLLGLSEVITVDKMGPQATVLKGQLGSLDGIPVLWTAELGATASNGKISSTGGNNVRGSLNIVHRGSHAVGYRRRVKVVSKYFEEYDSYQLIANVRLAFGRQDADSSSVLYNIATS